MPLQKFNTKELRRKFYQLKQAFILFLLRRLCYHDMLKLNYHGSEKVMEGDIAILNYHHNPEKEFGEVLFANSETIYMRLYRRAK